MLKFERPPSSPNVSSFQLLALSFRPTRAHGRRLGADVGELVGVLEFMVGALALVVGLGGASTNDDGALVPMVGAADGRLGALMVGALGLHGWHLVVQGARRSACWH